MKKPLRIAVRKFDPFETALEKLWAGFCTQKGIDIPVELIPLELHDLYESTMTQKGLINGDWDIAHLNTDWIKDAADAKAVENLVPWIEKMGPNDYPSAWHNSLLKLQSIDQGIYGLPFHDGPECLIYRIDLFDNIDEQLAFKAEFGYELEPPTTWEQFVDIAGYFHRPEQGLYGCVFANYPDGHNMVFDFALQLWTQGGEFISKESGKVDLNTPQGINALEFYRKLVNNTDVVHPKSKSFGSVEAGMAFAHGQAAMTVNWFGFASMSEVIEDSRVKGKVNVSNLPSHAGNNHASLNVYWLYTLASGSQYKELAYEFMCYATTAQSDLLLTLEGGIGCRKSTWSDPTINAQIPFFHHMEELHTHAKTLPQLATWPKIAALIDQMVLSAIESKTPSEELIAKTQQQINTLQDGTH